MLGWATPLANPTAARRTAGAALGCHQPRKNPWACAFFVFGSLWSGLNSFVRRGTVW